MQIRPHITLGAVRLDEIGDLSAAMQSKLLQVLEDSAFERVGESQPISVDIRIISATNINIQDAIRRGTLRADLFYRLAAVTLHLPPLRERRKDIPLFVSHFIKCFSEEYKIRPPHIRGSVLDILCAHNWPGNIRELQHAIEKAVILCEGNVIRPKDILVKQTWKPQTTSTVPNLEEVERQAIETAILQNNGNLTAAAEQLGISRQTLYNKLKRFKP